MPGRRRGAGPPTWRAEVRRVWSSAAAGWVAWEPLLLHALGSVDGPLVRALAPAPGQRVLDVGCGLGEPSLAIAPWVEPRGEVVGIDVARPMIDVAKRRAKASPFRNVRFRVADASRLPASLGRFDRIVSRYGSMFFERPLETFAALRARLKPRGRIALAVWGPAKRNAYFRIVAESVYPLLDAPPPDPETVPHAMRYARVRVLERLLLDAGFHRVRSEGVRTPFVVPSAATYARLVLDVSGSTRALLEKVAPGKRKGVVRSLERGARRYVDGSVVRLPGFSWVVSAER